MRTSYDRGKDESKPIPKQKREVKREVQGTNNRPNRQAQRRPEQPERRGISQEYLDMLYYDRVFSDGYSDEYIEDYYKICREVDDALEEEYKRISKGLRAGREGYEEDYQDDLEDEEDNDNGVYDYSDDSDEDMEDSEEDEDGIDEYEDTPKKKSKKWIWISLSGIFLVIAICVSLFIFSGMNNVNSISDLQAEIDKLYTSEDKLDVREAVSQGTLDDLSRDLERLDDVSESEKKSVQNELDTIEYYIADSNVLDNINKNSYDLNDNGLSESISKVTESAKSYSVPGLAITISTKVKNINDDLEYYVNLRNELTGITDYSTFDEAGYQSKIEEVSHDPNKEELQSMYDKIVSAKKAQEEAEKLKESQDKEAKKKAEELQKQTQEELNAAKEELDKYKEQGSQLLEDIKNSLSKEKDTENSENQETDGQSVESEETSTTEESNEESLN